MKRIGVFALMLILTLSVPFAVALDEVLLTEDFEDDPVGSGNPTGDYTINEEFSSSVQVVSSPIHSGNRAMFIDADGDWGNMIWDSPWDMCAGDRMEFWFRPTYNGGGEFSAQSFLGIRQGPYNGPNNYYQQGDEALGISFSGSTATMSPAAFDAAGNRQVGSIFVLNPGSSQWYKVVFENGQCDASSSVDMTVYNSAENIIGSSTASCTCNFSGTGYSSVIATSAIAGTSTASGDYTFYLDDFELLSVDEEPPAALTGVVTKTGSLSTTGKLELTWPLSVDDPDQDTGDLQYDVYVNGTLHDSDTVDSDDASGVRSFTYAFTGSESFGSINVTVRAGGSLDSCSITVNLDALGDTDTCGDSVLFTSGPAEFDTGLISTLESVGIITVESKMLFTLIAVGVSTVGMAGALRLMAPGRMKNYVILAIPALLALLMIFMDFLTPWEFIVALVLGVFATLRMSVFQNTYHELRERLFQARMGSSELVDRFRPSRGRELIDIEQAATDGETGDGDGEA